MLIVLGDLDDVRYNVGSLILFGGSMSYFIDVVKKYWDRFLVKVLPIKTSEPVRKSRVQGFPLVTVLEDWSGFRYPGEHVVILTDIDVSKKGMDFWAKLPKAILREFVYSGVVVLRCNDLAEAMNLLYDIPFDFADAHIFVNGSHVAMNGGNL